jgi:hypothetical protein
MVVLWRDPTGRVTLEEHEDDLSSVTVIYKANDTREAGTLPRLVAPAVHESGIGSRWGVQRSHDSSR